MENARNKLSKYAEELKEEAKSRYRQKISFIGGVDPFLSGFSCNLSESESCPPVDSCDLLSYLVLKTSFLTVEQFRARKGLDAYNQFVSGWVKDVKIWNILDKHLAIGRVSKLSGKVVITRG